MKGHDGKYLWAEDDQQRISQKREKLVEQALWRVKRVPSSNLIRLISCYETFLTANIEDGGWSSFRFKGHSLKLLQERLLEETGIDEDFAPNTINSSFV